MVSKLWVLACGGLVVDSLSFAKLLRQQRRSRGLTQEELADRARLSVRAISDLERGVNKVPRSSTVRLLIEALGLAAAEGTQLKAAAQPLTRAWTQHRSPHLL